MLRTLALPTAKRCGELTHICTISVLLSMLAAGDGAGGVVYANAQHAAVIGIEASRPPEAVRSRTADNPQDFA